MSDPIITNNDLGSVVLRDAVHRDDILTLAGADTIAEGTILARSSATGKLVIFVKGGSTAGNGIPKAIVTEEYVSTGAGDIAIRAMVTGEVYVDRLVIDADGDASNVDNAVIDELRDYGIVATVSTELNRLDNQ